MAPIAENRRLVSFIFQGNNDVTKKTKGEPNSIGSLLYSGITWCVSLALSVAHSGCLLSLSLIAFLLFFRLFSLSIASCP